MYGRAWLYWLNPSLARVLRPASLARVLRLRLHPPLPLLALFSSPFILVFPFPFCVHVLVLLFGVQVCPVNPYLEWLGVAGKAQGQGFEYGLVRCRILYYCIGGFFPCPAPVPSLLLLSRCFGRCRAQDRPRPCPRALLGLSLGVLGDSSPRLRPWAQTRSGLGPQIIMPHSINGGLQWKPIKSWPY